ncbi:MAG: hypothetical protein EBX40_02565 [Gammaproteobacteria bacterium]|nr:hypothetical protein [Gammaproteobacteria bacterium]
MLDEAFLQFDSIIKIQFQIATFQVVFEFANAALIPIITRAFSHLKQVDAKGPADLTIRLWDSASTRTSLPPLNWAWIDRGGYGFRGIFEEGVYFQYWETLRALSVYHVGFKRAYFVAQDVELLPWWVQGSPLQAILHWWLKGRGLQLTHSAAVGTSKGALLFTGQGGRGKSTTTLTCLKQGFHYLGEDYCVLAPGKEPMVYSVYQSAKLEAKTRSFFPELEPFIQNRAAAESSKALLFYENIFPGQIQTQLPLKAIIALKIGANPRPSLAKLPPRPVLADLMLSTLKQLPLFDSQSTEVLKKIADSVPGYELTLCSNLSENAAMLHELLEGGIE